jgi:hypothetical protein
VRRFMANRDQWRGTAQELLLGLTPLVGEQAAKERDWPKRPNTLAGKVRRAAPALRKIGIHVAFDRDGHDGARIIAIEKRGKPEQRPESLSAPSGSSAKIVDSNKINDLAAKAADDALTMADDPADDALTILNGAIVMIVSSNPLKGNGSDDADDADDVSAFCSGGGGVGAKPDASPGWHRMPDDEEPQGQIVVNGFAISSAPEDRKPPEPGQLFPRVRIRTVKASPIATEPDEDLFVV